MVELGAKEAALLPRLAQNYELRAGDGKRGDWRNWSGPVAHRASQTGLALGRRVLRFTRLSLLHLTDALADLRLQADVLSHLHGRHEP